MLSPWLKLGTGVAATALIASAAWQFDGGRIVTSLARESAKVMLAHGIEDGTVTLRRDSGWVFRTPRLSGTASRATRAAVSAEAAGIPGVHNVEWRDR
jgi:hypothetical protein